MSSRRRGSRYRTREGCGPGRRGRLPPTPAAPCEPGRRCRRLHSGPSTRSPPTSLPCGVERFERWRRLGARPAPGRPARRRSTGRLPTRGTVRSSSCGLAGLLLSHVKAPPILRRKMVASRLLGAVFKPFVDLPRRSPTRIEAASLRGAPRLSTRSPIVRLRLRARPDFVPARGDEVSHRSKADRRHFHALNLVLRGLTGPGAEYKRGRPQDGLSICKSRLATSRSVPRRGFRTRSTIRRSSGRSSKPSSSFSTNHECDERSPIRQ